MLRILLPLLLCGCFRPTGLKNDDTGASSSGEVGSVGTSMPTTSSPTSSSSTSGESSLEITSNPTSSGPDSTSSSSSSSSSSSGTSGGSSSSSSPGTSSTGSVPAICGNGIQEEGEACDDGNDDNGDGCDEACQRDALFIFVTSSIYPPNFQNTQTADALCTLYAEQTTLLPQTEYVAWMSGVDSPVDRMGPNPALPYILPDHTPVAANLPDLIDAMLLAPINQDETGKVHTPEAASCMNAMDLAWTATTATGMISAVNCDLWVSNLSRDQGLVGRIHEVNGSWSALCNQNCALKARLYCVEKTP